jgi:hypothetical protein
VHIEIIWSHSFQTTLIHILVKEQVNLQLGHVKHIGDANSSFVPLISTPTTMDPIRMVLATLLSLNDTLCGQITS